MRQSVTQVKHLSQNRTFNRYSVNLNHLYPLVTYIQGGDIQSYKEKASARDITIK